MPWRELILHLDYPGFILPSPEALSLIMTAYNMACREPFPLECVHLAWSNPRGQVRANRSKSCLFIILDPCILSHACFLQTYKFFHIICVLLFLSFLPYSHSLPFFTRLPPLSISFPPLLPLYMSLSLCPLYPSPLPPSLQLSWYQQVLAGCPEFNVSQYMGESIDMEPFKIVLTSEEAKPW